MISRKYIVMFAMISDISTAEATMMTSGCQHRRFVTTVGSLVIQGCYAENRLLTSLARSHLLYAANVETKKIHCHICNELGHIYCGSNDDDLRMPTSLFCYNCGESCHSGLLCPKPLVDQSGLKPPSICYKCGDEGHLARNCVKSSVVKQGAPSELGPETEDGDEHQNRKKARRSKSFKQGRARR